MAEEKTVRYDIAIIGTGPAGISAAITAKLREKNVLLIGNNNTSDKLVKAQCIKNYPGLPEISGEDFAVALIKHLDSMNISITDDRINGVYLLGDYYAIQGRDTQYEATTVILATGMSAVRQYPGEQENLGRGVSYCATCDGALYRGKKVAVVAYSSGDEPEADFLAGIVDKVYYLPMYDLDRGFSDNVDVIRDNSPVSIEKTEDGMKLALNEGDITVDGIFILREQLAPSNLVPGLKMADNHVEVNRNMETSMKGLFACGDITGAPYQYVKAAGEGNVAALSAVKYLS